MYCPLSMRISEMYHLYFVYFLLKGGLGGKDWIFPLPYCKSVL